MAKGNVVWTAKDENYAINRERRRKSGLDLKRGEKLLKKSTSELFFMLNDFA
jgi:hypothetical protein